MVTVAMSAIMRNDLTKKTMLKVNMSMMTTMTTALHRDLENHSSHSPFSTVQVACIPDVLWSSRCWCVVLEWVARPCVGLCSNAFFFRRSYVILPAKLFHFGLRVFLFTHALFYIAHH